MIETNQEIPAVVSADLLKALESASDEFCNSLLRVSAEREVQKEICDNFCKTHNYPKSEFKKFAKFKFNPDVNKLNKDARTIDFIIDYNDGKFNEMTKNG